MCTWRWSGTEPPPAEPSFTPMFIPWGRNVFLITWDVVRTRSQSS